MSHGHERGALLAQVLGREVGARELEVNQVLGQRGTGGRRALRRRIASASLLRARLRWLSSGRRPKRASGSR